MEERERGSFVRSYVAAATMSQPSTRPWLDFLLPASCLGCGARPARAGCGLCVSCRRRLREVAQPSCPVCGRSGVSVARCGACSGRAVAYDRLLAGWLYVPPCDRVITALKFRGLDYLGAEVARHLAGYLSGELAGCEVVVPVPLHWSRRLRRGYNQTERLASPLASELGLPLATALRRRRRTRPQTSLGRGPRLGALTGAFVAAAAASVDGARVLLVDDVATTGATLSAAAEALAEAGARGVTALVAARVPGPGETV
jgi:ComF family protein